MVLHSHGSKKLVVGDCTSYIPYEINDQTPIVSKKYKSWLKQNGTTASPWDEIYYCVICNCLTSKKLETIRDSTNFEKYRSQIMEGKQKVDYDTLVEIVRALDVEGMYSMIGVNFEFQCTNYRIPKMIIKNATSVNPELFTINS